MQHPNINQGAVEVFLKSWQIYQEIIKHNYMFHRELSEATQTALQAIQTGQPLRILDMGCGDASMVRLFLSSDQVAMYTGCDLSQPALDIAKSELDASGISHRLLCDDMVRIATEQADGSMDLVFSSYALHHLNAIEKERTLREVVRILAPGGAFVLIDIFREPDEDRAAYMDNYMGALRQGWTLLNEASQNMVINHATEFDYPETPGFYRARCAKFGLNHSQRLGKHTWHEAWIFTR